MISQVRGEGDLTYGFRVIDFSHEEGKQVVVWDSGFVHAIASTACEFLYLTMNT